MTEIQFPVKNEVEVLNSQQDDGAFSMNGFEHAQRVAAMLAKSQLIPDIYKNNVQNTMIAMEMAHRVNASPLMVMQNLYIVQGKPSWSSSFIIGCLNACKRFSPLRFEMTGEEGKDNYGCTAWAYDLATGDRLEGPKITWKMANSEGWSTKAGSKWKTMPDLMFRYRAAAFFGRLYAPDILMGMQTAEEVFDVNSPGRPELPNLNDAVTQMKGAKSDEDFMIIRESFPELKDVKEFEKQMAYYQRKNLASSHAE